MKSITHFITQKLKLKVNEAKSAVARPQERKFLGVQLYGWSGGQARDCAQGLGSV
jgi:hypothetical protein